MLFRKSLLLITLAALTALVFAGCGDEEDLAPVLTRVQASAECGVAPLDVQFLAIASGGNQLADPTGGNSYLNYDWDFDDGSTGNGSITSHTFASAGLYEVSIDVTDDDGDHARLVIPVEVRADSMVLTTTPDTTVVASWTSFETPTPRASNGAATGAIKSGLVINEVMLFNETILADTGGDFGAFIEVLNTGDSAVNLQNFSLTTDLYRPDMHVLGNQTVIEPGEYQIIWLDGKDLNSEDPHTEWDILDDINDPSEWTGATIYLMHPANRPLDSVVLSADQQVDVSTGRTYDAATGGTVELNVWADICGFDMDLGDYTRFDFHWTVDDVLSSSYEGRSPMHMFRTGDVGQRTIELLVFDTFQSVYRTATVTVDVQAP